MNRFLSAYAVGMCGKVLLSLVGMALLASPGLAHFLYLIPAKDPGKVQVIFSETLNPEDRIALGNLSSLKLTARAHGQNLPVQTIRSKHCVSAKVPEGTSLVFGTAVYGLMSRGEVSSLLVYHPKLLLGSGAERSTAEKVGLEIVPHEQGGHTRFQLLHEGNPVACAEGVLLLAEGTKENLKTDHNGFTAAFAGKGRYGLWLRHVLTKPGEHEGKKYAEEKHYATLVGDFPAVIPDFRPLPTAVSAPGATTCDGYLYVYGGHFGIGHTYTTQDVIGEFRRLDLAEGKVWEPLPGGPIAQELSLVSHRGKVIRIGGMQPRNDPGQPEDNLSLSSCALYEPKTNSWTDLPAMPAGRCSHEAVVAGDKIVVVGGWQLKGADSEPIWHNTALILDLSQSRPHWRSIAQPFKRRALTAAAVGNQVYVLCGLGEKGELSSRADILDLETLNWSVGPQVPGDQVGYGPAATTFNGQLLLNTFDGPVYSLEPGATLWQKVAHTGRPRMVHRLVPYALGVLLVGGATPEGSMAELEYLLPSAPAGLPVSLGIKSK